ncbi:Neuropeptide FF receptor 2 [Halotydeus destructor]|nr:Neuropeptide FF receptor 2 [Halotydeus destructor]
MNTSAAGSIIVDPDDPWSFNSLIYVQDVIWNARPFSEVIWRVLLNIPIVVLGILGNLLIISVVYKFKQTRNCTNLFICNMALADLLATLCCSWASLFQAGVIYQNYVLGPFYCWFEGFMKVTFLLASVLSLITVCCDRMIGIVRPFSKRLTTKKAYIVMAAIWVLALALAAPVAFGRKLEVRYWKNFTESFCNEQAEFIKSYWIALLCLLVYLPLVAITVAYTVILCRLSKYEARLGDRGNPVKVKYRREILRMLFIYVITCLICWLPLQFMVIQRKFGNTISHKTWLLNMVFFTHICAALNSAVNPIIYGIMNETFRRASCLMFPKLRYLLRPTGDTIIRSQRPTRQRTQEPPVAPNGLPIGVNSFNISTLVAPRDSNGMFSASGKAIRLEERAPGSEVEQNS